MADELFTKIMRKETRKIHNLSDALVNAKLGMAASDNNVWAEGLLVFYEIFKYLENALDRNSQNKLGQLDISGMRRLQAFEQDLRFYLGENWKQNYDIRESVQEYLNHLTKLESEEPILLTPYIYHLYMGLFAGGQILLKKRKIALKFSLFKSTEDYNGLAVINLEGKGPSIKKKMAENMNKMADDFSPELKERILKESSQVFVLNNKIISSCKGVNNVLANKFIKYTIVGLATAVLVNILLNYFKY